MRTVKTLIRLGGCPGWSVSSLGTHVSLLFLSYCSLLILDCFGFMHLQCIDDKNPKCFGHPKKCCNFLMFEQGLLYHTEMDSKDQCSDRTANGDDADQSVPSWGVVWSGSTRFVRPVWIHITLFFFYSLDSINDKWLSFLVMFGCSGYIVLTVKCCQISVKLFHILLLFSSFSFFSCFNLQGIITEPCFEIYDMWVITIFFFFFLF